MIWLWLIYISVDFFPILSRLWHRNYRQIVRNVIICKSGAFSFDNNDCTDTPRTTFFTGTRLVSKSTFISSEAICIRSFNDLCFNASQPQTLDKLHKVIIKERCQRRWALECHQKPSGDCAIEPKQARI